ncbi:MAG: nucleotidyltransferase domain-containing protein [Clostridia bacterium]|nr:nucleotidyltransferase domain-containing protein [Clostridia bacterium]
MKRIPNNIEQIIEEFTKKTKILLGEHLKQIILYGSYARGDFNENSDIDIMILIDMNDIELENYYEKIIELSYDIESKNNFKIHLSPLVKNIDKFNYWLDTIPFYMNIEREGVSLNG